MAHVMSALASYSLTPAIPKLKVIRMVSKMCDEQYFYTAW